MSRELLAEERYNWLRNTLKHLASVPHLNDEDFTYTVFEVLDIDVRSCLHETNLDRLGTSAALTRELLDVGSHFLAMIDSMPDSSSVALARIERRSGWMKMAEQCEAVLKTMQRADFKCLS